MSFAAVQKYVAVLERSGLVQKRAHGREQLVSTNHGRLQRMAQLDDVLLQRPLKSRPCFGWFTFWPSTPRFGA